MLHITKIDDALAWCRFGSLHKQCEVYKRGETHYLKHGGGYVRIAEKFGNEWLTAVPTIKVVEIEGFSL